ncbi:MAG: hypothetical protein ABSE63_01850 [Thermoguttaceae bacterium]|jgi:hypothetical protein
MGKKTELKLAPQFVGNSGLFYVCYRLSLLGWNALPTSRNARGVDLVCFSMDGHRMHTFQIKTLSKRNPVPLGKDIDKLIGDFWIIVANIITEHPETYIFSPDEIKSMAHKGEKDGKISYWLQPKQYAIDAFHEKWERIGNG